MENDITKNPAYQAGYEIGFLEGQLKVQKEWQADLERIQKGIDKMCDDLYQEELAK